MAEGGEQESFVWTKGSAADDDVWDDRLLIEAYERASKQANAALKKKSKLSSSRTSSMSDLEKGDTAESNKPRKLVAWKLNHFCRCIYAEDGIEYEAQIKKLLPEEESCLVKYIGYNNEEKQLLSSLKKTRGKEARQTQINESVLDEPLNSISDEAAKFASRSKVESKESRKRFVPPMPPPPAFFDNSGSPEDEALASMLMSWYMSGYHTGYYRALKLSKSHCNCKPDNKAS